MFQQISKFLNNNKNSKKIEDIRIRFVNPSNDLDDEISKLNDDEIKNKAKELKALYSNNDSNEISESDIITAVSLVKEVSKRTIQLKHYDSQVIVGICLYFGKVTEMKTGEGKTLAATIPAFLNYLSNNQTHLITVNDYLAKRDSEWMNPIYNFLGMTNTYIQNEMSLDEKIGAYQSDIVYGNNNEFCFDFLRDNLRSIETPKIQKKHDRAIIDEADSVLIDEARSPLGISGQVETPIKMFQICYKLTENLETSDVEINEERKNVLLNDEGIKKIEFNLKKINLLKGDNLFDSQNLEAYQIINQSLKARFIFKLDKDYVVRNNQIVIIDEFSGRLSEGRRYGEGLHQSIEAKENLTIQPESTTLASITFQNYFKKYDLLSGMTGTAVTEAEEFNTIYGLEVIEIPTNKKLIRKDLNDQIFKTPEEKYEAIVSLVKKKKEKSQPVLIGTTSIQKSELISELLTKNGITHNVLNAKNHENEATIIAQAGKPNQITVATNMAGRGTDIKLGGNPEFDKENFNRDDYNKVIASGGLSIVGTERHESRRIDNQLRGRSGRQGDPGESIFFVSLEDDLMRIFGSEKLQTMLSSLGLKKGEVIEHKWLTSSIERAQKRVEGHNFDIRKQLIEFDNIINKQREIIYSKREDIIEGDLFDFLNEVENEFFENIWDEEDIKIEFTKKLPLINTNYNSSINEIIEELKKNKLVQYNEHKENYLVLMKQVALMTVDKNWQNQIQELSNIRQSVAFSGNAGKDPINEFKKGAFNSFNNLIYKIQEDIVLISNNLKFRIGPTEEKKTDQDLIEKKIGRNDPCPCGSGKKYKQCHGK
ncbi:preprotein translocase subunit SecA [Alphaproteobacteria bacterium]|nr:preprotein translocase subunit SecA [Alphaproteobacteria bacterium]